MTPKEWAEELEGMPPVFIKQHLVQMLEWQAAKGKHLVHVGWYLRCIAYAWKTRYERANNVRPKAGSPTSIQHILATMRKPT